MIRTTNLLAISAPTMITDEIFRWMYFRDIMDYGKSLTSEAVEAALIIAGTTLDDAYC